MKLSEITKVMEISATRTAILSQITNLAGVGTSYIELKAPDGTAILFRDASREDERQLYEAITDLIRNFYLRRLGETTDALKSLGIDTTQ
jgi:hypothetical protein